jgi:hypothetical protein
LPLAVGAGLLLNWISEPHAWGAALKSFAANLLPYFTLTHSAILLFYFLFALMAWFGWQALAELRQHPGSPIEWEADRLWFICDVLVGLLFFGVALAIDLRTRSLVIENALKIIGEKHLWQPLVGAAVAAAVYYALTAYVADVAVYVNADAKSKNYAARNAILTESTAALKGLLACGSYDRVILAGHSLGSVIAYDTINELLSEYNAAPGIGDDHPDPMLTLNQLQTLKGLVTFGSPLDKIYYFFRQHVKRDQAIRAQILSMLYSFRKIQSGRDYGEFKFNYSFSQLDELEWLNAWAPRDPVSGKLKFYNVNDRREFHYRVPVLAHLSYWGDPNFYEYFCGKLL